jgi:hypothetical protein
MTYLAFSTANCNLGIEKPFTIMTFLCPGYGGPAGGGDGGEEDGGLEVNIPGIPGQDYPIYSEVSQQNNPPSYLQLVSTDCLKLQNVNLKVMCAILWMRSSRLV